MPEIRTVTTLQHKRDEIARSIDDYEARLAQANADLAHIDAAIAIFATGDGQKPVRPHVDIHRLFKRGELADISREDLKGRPTQYARTGASRDGREGPRYRRPRAGQGRLLQARTCAADTGAGWQDCLDWEAQGCTHLAFAGIAMPPSAEMPAEKWTTRILCGHCLGNGKMMADGGAFDVTWRAGDICPTCKGDGVVTI